VVILISLRTWLFYWLIGLVGFLWAAFLLADETWFWVSVWLILAVAGTNLLGFVMRFR
jgi:hypothetical protein